MAHHILDQEVQAFWDWVAPLLRRAYGYEEMTPDETEAFLDTVEAEPLLPAQIDAVLARLRQIPRTKEESHG